MYDKIIRLTKKNGEILKKKAGNTADIGITKKYLTELDLKIEKDFANLIEKLPGNHKVYSEELNDVFQNSENIWVIDPISGTHNFINGFPHYSIVVSRIFKGQVIFALVYDPAFDELFVAEKNKGATLNDRRVTVNKKQVDTIILYEYSSAFWSHQKGLDLMSELTSLGKVKKSFGSMGIHYSYVACGRAGAAVTFNKDTFPEFAGKLLVEEAGGKSSDFKGQEITHTTKGVIFSNNTLHQSILKITANY